MKNHGKKGSTTSAEDTQNEHDRRVRTVVDSFLKLLLFLRSVDMAGVYTPPRLETAHRNMDTHQQVLINFFSRIHQEIMLNSVHPSQLASPGQCESWMNCFVTRDLHSCFSNVIDSSVMQMRPVRMSI